MEPKRYSVAEAAEALGVSQDAVRKRIKRGTVEHGKDDRGRIYVLLDPSETRRTTHQESDQDAPAGMVEVLRDEISHLRRESERKDAIIMQLSQATAEQARTIRALEAPDASRGEQNTGQESPRTGPERSSTPETGEVNSEPRGGWISRWFGR